MTCTILVKDENEKWQVFALDVEEKDIINPESSISLKLSEHYEDKNIRIEKNIPFERIMDVRKIKRFILKQN